MLKFLLLLVLILSCTTKQERKFTNKEVCFLLYDLEAKKLEDVINEKRCSERFPPASTFKVPLAVMAFDSKVLKDHTHAFKWDGHKHSIEPWNKDHTAATWMRDSVVWYSQIITPMIGEKRIQNYLEKFEYGNKDTSGGIQYFWLTPAPMIDKPMNNSLKISGAEQLKFLEKLWRGELPVSIDAINKAKGLLVSEESANKKILTGKTGSGNVGEGHSHRLGWFVGYLRSEEKNYVVVINFTDTVKEDRKSYGGPEAKELLKTILAEKNLW